MTDLSSTPLSSPAQSFNGNDLSVINPKTMKGRLLELENAAKRAMAPLTGKRRSVQDGLAVIFVEQGKLPTQNTGLSVATTVSSASVPTVRDASSASTTSTATLAPPSITITGSVPTISTTSVASSESSLNTAPFGAVSASAPVSPTLVATTINRAPNVLNSSSINATASSATSNQHPSVTTSASTLPALATGSLSVVSSSPSLNISSAASVANSTPSATPAGSNASAPGTSMGPSTPTAIVKTPPKFLNNKETTKIEIAVIGRPFASTIQLVHYAHLLRSLDQASKPVVSTEDQEWIEKVRNDEKEQRRIDLLLVGIVNKFIALPTIKDSDHISEVILVGPVLKNRPFHVLFRYFLNEFYKDTVDPEMLQGLVQLVEDAPPNVLEVDSLVKTLEKIRTCLKETSLDSPAYVLPLTQAISRILRVMEGKKQILKNLDRVKAHYPVRNALADVKAGDNPYLVYHAVYALQALRGVPDNESAVECFFRLFVKNAGDIAQASQIAQMNFHASMEGMKEIQKSIKEIFDLTKEALEGLSALKEGGMEIKDLFSSKKFNPWFVCLRGAEDFARQGRFVDLSNTINNALCQGNQHFQWGICQLLAEIAVDPTCDLITRRSAVDYFDWMYSITQHKNVKGWILTLVGFIAELRTVDPKNTFNDSDIRSNAAELFERLKKDKVKLSFLANILKKGATKPLDFQDLLRQRLLLPLTFPLLSDQTPDIETRLYSVQMAQENHVSMIYVPLMCKKRLQDSSTKDLKPLEETVKAFLGTEKEVLLILGDSGAGKSTFSRQLEQTLWNEYIPDGSIPLFLDLRRMGKLDDTDVIQTKLEGYDFEPREIRKLKMSRKFVFVCDGYDECRPQRIHLYEYFKSRLECRSFQIVITCRTQYLESTSDRMNFEPQAQGRTARKVSMLYEETVIVPFNPEQIQICIDKFTNSPDAKDVFDDEPVWGTEMYLKHLTSLMDLVKNPFLLYIALRVLPDMAKDGRDLSATQFTRFELYDEFMRQHFENEKSRLTTMEFSEGSEEKRAFELLREEFYLHGMGFLKRLAYMVFTYNEGKNAIEYLTFREMSSWKAELFGSKVDARIKLLRQRSRLESYMMIKSEKSEPTKWMYQFFHKSILEFLYSCELCDHLDSADLCDYIGNSQYRTLSDCLSIAPNPLLLKDHPLNERSIVTELSILDFLVDHVKQKNSKFKKQLIAIINLSKTNDKVCPAAANAITILVRAGVRFNNQEFQGIRIPGADLSGGQFDGAQMQGADLTSCTLYKVWLRAADLTGAKMGNVNFGELPCIQAPSPGWSRCYAYSPDKKMYAIATAFRRVEVYDTLNWTRLQNCRGYVENVLSLQFSHDSQKIISLDDEGVVQQWDTKTGLPCPILENHPGEVKSMTFSPDGEVIVTGGEDGILRLWDAQTGALGLTWKGHTASIASVTYSPNGQQIASGGDDCTVRLWNAYTGEQIFDFRGHTDTGRSVVHSPVGQQIASSSSGQMIQLWDTQTGMPGFILKGSIWCKFIYSPDGLQIASGGEGNSVRLWNSQTGALSHTLNGHNEIVRIVVFSPGGQQIASGSDDGTVRLWNVQSGALDAILEGHAGPVIAVEYLLDGRQVVSCCWKGTVRLWDVQMSTARTEFNGHSDVVTSIVFSHDGEQVASASRDKTVRLWDTKTGGPGPILQGHKDVIDSVAFSPDRQEIVSGSDDGTVRLWDARSGASVRIFNERMSRVESVAYSPNGKYIASGSGDGTVWLWDSQTEAIGHVFHGHARIFSITQLFSVSDEKISFRSGQDTVQICDIQTGALGPVLNIHDKSFIHMTFSPDGQHIATTSSDLVVRLWDASTGNPGPIFKVDAHVICALVYSPCGMQIAVGCLDGKVYLCNTQTGTPDWTLHGHSNRVVSIAYSSNGQQIISGSDDGTVQLWNANSAQCLAKIVFLKPVNSIVWHDSINGSYFAVGCGDNSVSVWKAEEKDGSFNVSLLWTTSQNRLHMAQTRIRRVQDLGDMNRRLLKQRGAEMSDDENYEDNENGNDSDGDENDAVNRMKLRAYYKYLSKNSRNVIPSSPG